MLGKLDDDLLVKAQFVSTHISKHYDAIQVSILNRTDGVVDKETMLFGDIIGQKFTKCSDKVNPYMWEESTGKAYWYTPISITEKANIADTVLDYIGMFQEDSLAIVFTYFTVFADSTHKDNPLTKIYVLIVSALIIALLFTAYIFVYKQEDVSLTNGQATLWDTKTVELADKICADFNTDEEKVKAIYKWMIHNFDYDYKCEPFVQYFNVRKTLSTRKGICYDFAHLFASLCRSQNIPCYVVDGTPYNPATYCHTWNRVYFNGSWRNMDATFDTVQIKSKGELYGFRNIENAHSLEKEYFITKIY